MENEGQSMEEATFEDDILSDTDRLIIARAVDSSKYKESPVPSELTGFFSDDLTSFVSIPYSAKSKL